MMLSESVVRTSALHVDLLVYGLPAYSNIDIAAKLQAVVLIASKAANAYWPKIHKRFMDDCSVFGSSIMQA
jgi:hypothetical protein